MALTPKQQRFCEEYLIDLNATQAAIRAGYSENGDNRIGYYVYLLVDKRTSDIFYIGKGKGNRCTQHLSEVKGNRCDNGKKAQRINDMLMDGEEPLIYVLESDMRERDAFSLERYLIGKFKAHGLTNIQNGVVSAEESAACRARILLSRVKPFATWYNDIRNDPCPWLPKKRDIETLMGVYFMVVNSLKGLSDIDRPVLINNQVESTG